MTQQRRSAKYEEAAATNGAQTAARRQQGGLTGRSRTLLITGVYLLMLCFAVSVTMLGPLMPELIAQYGLRLSEGGLMVSARSIGGVLAIVLGGLLADRWNKGMFVAASFLIYVISLFFIATAPLYTVLLVMFFFLGASTHMVDVVNNALAADLYPERRGAILNILHTIFGVGALLGPLLTRLVMGQGVSWAAAFGALGVVCALVLVVFSVILWRHPLPPAADTSVDLPSPKALLTDVRMFLLCGIMIMYVGHQIGIVTWLPMYMQDSLGASPDLASLALSALWMGIILGRFGCSRLPATVDPLPIIAYGGLAGGIVLTLGFVLQMPLLLTFSVALAGLFTGATIPLLVNAACEWFPRNTGTASSMIFLSGSLSAMLIPWLMGLVAELFGFWLAMMFSGVSLIFVFALSIAVMRLTRASNESLLVADGEMESRL